MAKTKEAPDYFLVATCGALLFLGVLILASVSVFVSPERFGSNLYFLRRQLLFGFLPGITLGYLAFKIDLSFLKKFAPHLLFLTLILMLLVFVPRITGSTQGAVRWLNLGGIISFQPAEFLKLTLILYWAAWLSSKVKEIRHPPAGGAEKNPNSTFLPFLIILVILALLFIFQPDISTLGVIFVVSLIMYFSADTPVWHTILIGLLGTFGLILTTKISPYRIDRFLVFFNPRTDPLGIGYQLQQAVIAVGSGGIFGVGLGLSRQRFGFLPEPMSDSIFAIFAEETGFAGSLILVSLFTLFFWRIYKIVLSSKDKFSQLLALGIGSWIIFQAFVNISSMLNILPLTGIPLPFISYGGSSLVAELIGVGLLLNISQKRK